MAEWVNHWIDDEEFPSSDWREEVANDDTRLGYTEWVLAQREQWTNYEIVMGLDN
jgi:hypothetical protein